MTDVCAKQNAIQGKKETPCLIIFIFFLCNENTYMNGDVLFPIFLLKNGKQLKDPKCQYFFNHWSSLTHNEQYLPVNPICKNWVFSILLVTGCSGHLRSSLTKMALISPSTACLRSPPLSDVSLRMRGTVANGARQWEWGMERPVVANSLFIQCH